MTSRVKFTAADKCARIARDVVLGGSAVQRALPWHVLAGGAAHDRAPPARTSSGADR
jgi:hypothetical protein